jgi:hypothetical protein
MLLLTLTCTMVDGASSGTPSIGSVFRPDDPLRIEPDTQDASGVQAWTIDLFVDLATNLLGAAPADDRPGVRAANVNTIDEVPDSSWFTNRIVGRPLSIDEAVRGPLTGAGPAPGNLVVISSKAVGVAPGFTVKDENGEVWFISFDANGHPEAATGAIIVANKIFWTLGYWQVENVLTAIRPELLLIGDTATVRPQSGIKRPMRRDDLDAVLDRSHRSPDGSYRAVAARRLPGRPVGGFRYHGTRPDDPNDVIPHQHRRELRALKVFGAWTNLVDMKASNTLDVVITHNGVGTVRHYLQDVGSTFGTGALGPREYDEGWEHLYEGNLVWKRLFTLGFPIRPWHTVDYVESDAVGRFEGAAFDPRAWKPRAGTAALRHAQPDDLFWAARRVAAFSDDLIRALAATAMYTRADDERHLADVLIQRRDKIASAYLTAVTPLVDFTLTTDGALSFDNAAQQADVAPQPRGGYEVSWLRLDNATGAVTPIGRNSARSEGRVHVAAPMRLPDAPGQFVCARVTPMDAPYDTWRPVRACFRRGMEGWSLVGLERQAA